MAAFIMKNLPDRSCLESVAQRYPQVRPEVAEAYLYFMRAGAELGESVQKYFSKYELSSGRMTILMMLNGSQRSHTPAEIADWCGVSRATITGLIESLHRTALIERTVDPDDRRMVRIQLTKKGQETLDELLPGYFKFIDQAFGNLDDDERQMLIKIIKKLQPNFN